MNKDFCIIAGTILFLIIIMTVGSNSEAEN